MDNIHSKIKSDDLDLLFNSIIKLQTLQECYDFFEDIATINEVKSLAQRMHVAKLLSEKKTYSEIAEITGASTATISRVNKCLNYGTGGYKTILERIKK